jgi:hypothetical protein
LSRNSAAKFYFGVYVALGVGGNFLLVKAGAKILCVAHRRYHGKDQKYDYWEFLHGHIHLPY